MSRIKRARPALVVVVLALIAAVAGTALASPGPDANTSASLKKKLKKTNKTAKKAKKLSKQNAALLDELCGPGASVAGDATCTAPQGPKGDPGATNVTARLGPGSAEVAPGADASDTASCNPGEVATGGGYFLTGNATHSHVYNNLVQDTAQWQVSVHHDLDGSGSLGVVAQVLCATP